MPSVGASTVAAGFLASCAGYVAIGFTDRAGRMGPGDSCAGWLDASGAAQVVDVSTTRSKGVLMPEAQQDCHAVSGSLANGVLSVTFRRKLDTEVCVFFPACPPSPLHIACPPSPLHLACPLPDHSSPA